MSEEQAEAVDADADADAEGAGAADDADAEAADGADPEELATELESRDDEAVAAELLDLRDRVAALELELEEVRAERDDLESRLKRKQAEFENYKKRQEERRERERARATENLVERLLEVRDNLDRALDQDEDADIREGVEATFRQLDEVLDGEDVEPIEPEAGADVDPTRHEVLLRVESDHPEGTVAGVHRPGYEMAGKVLRPAQVTVSDAGDGDGDE